ncbi:MAG TPA: YkvA family protein [Syntrophomonas sp.]|nr:YkvA family protein [Syntrophomonas sp.]
MNKEGIDLDMAQEKMREAIMLIPNYLKLLYRLTRDSRVKTSEKALLLATAAYIVAPVDFLPDFIPFIGQVDDVLLAALVLKRFMNSISPQVMYQHWDGKPNLLKNIEQVLSWSRFFLPADIYEKVVRKSQKDPSPGHNQTIDVEYDIN